MHVAMGMSGVDNSGGTPEHPFLNLFWEAFSWAGNATGSGTNYDYNHFNYDSNSFPSNFNIVDPSGGDATFSNAHFGFMTNQQYYDYEQASFVTNYPAGRYVILYPNDAVIQKYVIGDGTYSSSGTAGRDFIDVSSPTAQGIWLQVTTLPASWNPVSGNKGIAIIYSPDATSGSGGSIHAGTNGTGTHEALWNAGEVFNQNATLLNSTVGGIPFLDRMRDGNFVPLRFMDWFLTTLTQIILFSTRNRPSDAMFFKWVTGGKMIPYEIAVALCNKLNRDMWCNEPMCGESSFATSLATLIRDGATDGLGKVWAGLNSNLKVWHEWGNEPWNGGTVAPLMGDTNLIGNSYAAYPGYKTAQASGITGSIADNGNGTATWHVTAGPSAGSIVTNATAASSIFGPTNAVLIGTQVTAQIATAGGDLSTWTLSQGQTVSTQANMSAGTDYYAFRQNAVRRAIVDGNTFKSILGSNRVYKVLSPQLNNGSNTGLIFTYSQSDGSTNPPGGGGQASQGGNAADWTGNAGANIDALSTAPYYGQTMPAAVSVDDIFDYMSATPTLPGGWIPQASCTISGTTLTVISTTNNNYFFYPNQNILTGATGFIVKQLTSTETGGLFGRGGTYQISQSQTVSSPTTMTFDGGMIANALGSGAVVDKSIADTFSVPYVCYESGQSLQAPNSGELATYESAERDQRMYTAYIRYLTLLSTIGQNVDGPLFTSHHVDATVYGVGAVGFWGAMESILQTVNRTTHTPPRWTALADYAGAVTVNYPPVFNGNLTFRLFR